MWAARKNNGPLVPKKEKPIWFTTDLSRMNDELDIISAVNEKNFQRTVKDFSIVKPIFSQDSITFDAVLGQKEAMDSGLKVPLGLSQSGIPVAQLAWYGSQSFIGYQLAALLSQHWLINKACLMPARDAVRKGFEITVNDGTDVDPKVLDEIRKLDKKYRLKSNMQEFIQMCRVFGYRVALFKVRTADPAEYYGKPFNIDGIMPGSYEGITQIDPYWISPELDVDAAANPGSIYFYEPTYWRISGLRIHRTHLIVIRNTTLPDILKPTYFYGGVPLPQFIYERVYAMERTANEAPQLALTKRTNIIHVDLAQAIAKQEQFEKRIQQSSFLKDNYGILAVGLKEIVEQFDTSLTDLDAVISSQCQLVAAIAEVPSVKLMGTSPKGFNATGEFDESSYHEFLESLQQDFLAPMVERHHEILIRSDICPEFGIAPFEVEAVWKSLDSMTAKEQADTNYVKAQTDQTLVASGAIDGTDIRERLINDPDSGYNGISGAVPEDPAEDPINNDPLDDPELNGQDTTYRTG